MYSRKASFLAAEEWNTAPFEMYPAIPIQTLLNYATRIPLLLEKFDQLLDVSCEQETQMADSIWREFGKIRGLLHTWEKSYILGFPGSAYWIRPTTTSTGLNTNSFCSQGPIWFPDAFVAITFTHSWAIKIVCLLHQERLESQFPSKIEKGSLKLIDESWFELSIRICRSMEFMVQDKLQLHGPASTLFPLRVATEAFRLDPLKYRKELKWCQKIVDVVVYRGFGSAGMI